MSDHCPISLSQGSETVLSRRLCRSFSLGYGFNDHCHGRGRELKSRRPRHCFFQIPTESRQFRPWSNLVYLGQCLSFLKRHAYYSANSLLEIPMFFWTLSHHHLCILTNGFRAIVRRRFVITTLVISAYATVVPQDRVEKWQKQVAALQPQPQTSMIY